MSSDPRSLVFLSVFKSGTHLMRRMLERLTGLAAFEPPIVPGRVDYRDPGQLMFVPGHFYSWHLVPVPEVCARLRQHRARCVFLLRNVGDLTVSMYHHFADNIDADIGRGRNVDHHFRALSAEDGIHAIITGMQRDDFHWRGLGPHLHQMDRMLEFARTERCFVTTFERLTQHDRAGEVQRLAAFLEQSHDAGRIEGLLAETSFRAMRDDARARGVGSHYRAGKTGQHRERLTATHRDAVRAQLHACAPRLPHLVAEFELFEILDGF